MKILKKGLALCTSIVLLASLVAGCGSSSSQGQATGGEGNKDTVKPEVKTVNFWFNGGNQAVADYWETAINEFEEANSDIKVEITTMPSNPQEGETKLNAAKMSGTFPDVLASVLVFIGTRGSRGDFEDLTPYIEKWSDKSDIYESALDAGRYQDKVFGIGFQPNPEMLVYRKDFFREANIDPESPPRNWQELADYAVKLTQRDESGKVIRAGFDMPAIQQAAVFTDIFMRQNGSNIIDEENMIPDFTDEGAIEALQFLTDLYDQNVSIPFDFDKRGESPFITSKAAMGFMAPATLNILLNNNPELKDEIGYVPLLDTKQKIAFSGWQLLTMGSESKVKDEAWRFIEFMMSEDQMLKRLKETQTAVVRESLREQYLSEDPERNEQIMEYIKHGKGKAAIPWTSLANKHISLAYEEATNKKKTPEEALRDAQSNLEAELKAMNN